MLSKSLHAAALAVLAATASGQPLKWADQPQPLDCNKFNHPACEKKPEPKPPKDLGPVDRLRYDSCREAAAKNPTEAGVRFAIRLCREKFDQ